MKAQELLQQLTLEEKASLCSGEDFWNTKVIDRVNIPALLMTDGPNGVRLQKGAADHLGINESVATVCFPTASALAATFNKDLAHEAGLTLGNQSQALGLSILLGPGVNIKRSPLCGRNFEYYSEDPYVAGQMGKAYITGLQSQGIASCIKHFAANNQETRRATGNSIVRERPLHEIYLPAFETAVKEANVQTVMCSYNQINGTYASENKTLLTDILREKWGFEGIVITDWGAIKDRVKGLLAGLDLEMPGGDSSKENDKRIVEAVQAGIISEAELDKIVLRILELTVHTMEHRNANAQFIPDSDYQVAVKIAKEAAVLLKNEKDTLPVNDKQKIAFIGGFVEKPRYQGSGSSHINSLKVPTLSELIANKENISYAKGFVLEHDESDEKLFAEAVALAQKNDVAIIFAGLPNRFESEGVDRKHLDLPDNQNRLIQAIAEVQPNTIVVLHNGSPVRMPWLEQVKSVLEMYLAGDGVSEATLSLLFGDSNPSGKLAETFPLRIEDTPAYLDFPGESGVTEYNEGIFIGYRYYDKKGLDVLFPFGHGLSYTQFSYSDLKLSQSHFEGTDTLLVSLKIKNTGAVAGKEVVQLYVGETNSKVRRPLKELRHFEKIALNPGEEKEVAFTLTSRDLAYYEVKLHDFFAPSGVYQLSIGSSSRDIRLESSFTYTTHQVLPFDVKRDTTLADILSHEKTAPMMQAMLDRMKANSSNDEKRSSQTEVMGEGSAQMIDDMIQGMSLGDLVTFGAMNEEQLQGLIQNFNAQLH